MTREHFAEATFLNQPPLSVEEAANRLGQLSLAFSQMIKNPPGGAVEYQAFAQYTKDCFDNAHQNPRVVNFYKDILNVRRLSSPQYIAQVSRIAFQYYLRYMPVSNPEPRPYGLFPAHCQTESEWADNYDYIFSDPQATQVVDEAICTKDNEANKPKRYAGAKLAILAHADLLPVPFDLADLGCSVGLGQFQLGENLAFRNVRVKGSEEERSLIHWALRVPLLIKNNVGIDKVPDKDWQWVEACSTYAYQYRDPHFLAAQQRLFHERRNYVVVQGDMTISGSEEGGLADARRHFENGQSDVATAINSFWEVKDEDQDDPQNNFRQAINNNSLERAYLSLESMPRTLAILQEAAILREGGRYPEVAKDIYAPDVPYNLFSKVIGSDEPYQHLATYGGDFSCNQIEPMPLLLEKLHQQRSRGYLKAS